MKKVAILGTSGAGKSSLGRHIASKLQCRYVELDALRWNPGWQMTPDEIFSQKVSVALSEEHWVVDGNYEIVWPQIWADADTLVWLDYPFWIVFWRLFKRSIRRSITKELVCNGNRERLKTHFFSRESLFLWVLQTHWKRRRTLPENLQKPEYQHLRVIHLRSPKATNNWINSL